MPPSAKNSERAKKSVDRLDPSGKGKSYIQLKQAHNLFTQGKIDPEMETIYNSDHAILIARTIVQLSN